jgi:hypothetical protein
MTNFNGRKLLEATMAGSIHTVRSGTIKQHLNSTPNAVEKAVEMKINGNLVELTVTNRGQKELILVPITYFSHLVPDKE